MLQPGKADAGALFTSNISSTAFGPRGTQSVLSRITIGAAALFMLTALLLSMPALTGNVSVLQTSSETTNETMTNANTETKPSSQADTITNLNTNLPMGGETNSNTTVNANTTTNASGNK